MISISKDNKYMYQSFFESLRLLDPVQGKCYFCVIVVEV